MADIAKLLQSRGGKIGAAALLVTGLITGVANFIGSDEEKPASDPIADAQLEKNQRQLDAIFNNDPVTDNTTAETLARMDRNVEELYDGSTRGDIDDIYYITETFTGDVMPAFALWANGRKDYGLEYAATTAEAEANAITVCAHSTPDASGNPSTEDCEIIRSSLAGTPQCLTYSFVEVTKQVNIGANIRGRQVPQFVVNVVDEIPTVENKLALEHYPETREITCNFRDPLTPSR